MLPLGLGFDTDLGGLTLPNEPEEERGCFPGDGVDISDSISSAMEAGGAVSNGVGGALNMARSSSTSPLLLSRSASERGEASRNYRRMRVRRYAQWQCGHRYDLKHRQGFRH